MKYGLFNNDVAKQDFKSLLINGKEDYPSEEFYDALKLEFSRLELVVCNVLSRYSRDRIVFFPFAAPDEIFWLDFERKRDYIGFKISSRDYEYNYLLQGKVNLWGDSLMFVPKGSYENAFSLEESMLESYDELSYLAEKKVKNIKETLDTLKENFNEKKERLDKLNKLRKEEK